MIARNQEGWPRDTAEPGGHQTTFDGSTSLTATPGHVEMSGDTVAGARSWRVRRDEKNRRMESVRPWMHGPVLQAGRIIDALHLVIQPSDRIVLEGDNQKQADFLSRSLVKCDPKALYDLHLVISSISRPEHLTLFELGIAKKVDFSFAGSQSVRIAQLLEDGAIRYTHRS
jgi:malonate decarboxylase alpha subunit